MHGGRSECVSLACKFEPAQVKSNPTLAPAVVQCELVTCYTLQYLPRSSVDERRLKSARTPNLTPCVQWSSSWCVHNTPPMPAESLMSFGSSSLLASQPHFRAGEVDEFIEIMLMAHRHTNWRAATAANDGVIAPQTSSLQALATAYVNREDRWDVFGKTRKLVAVVITLYYSTLYVVHAIFRPHKQQAESDRWRPFCRKARIAHAQQHSSRVDKCEPNLETNTRNIERVKPRSSKKADILKVAIFLVPKRGIPMKY